MDRMSSKSAKSKTRSFGIPSPEEWDFRMLPQDTDIQTVIEYEYLRSSKFRDVIMRWHAKDFRETLFSTWAPNAGVLVDIGVFSRSDSARIRNLLKKSAKYFDLHHNSGPDSSHWDRHLKAEVEISECLNCFKKAAWSVKELIATLFENVSDPILLEGFLANLENDLPDDVKNSHAGNIALRFDRFPEPWVKIQNSAMGPSYLNRRKICAPIHSEAMWEIFNMAQEAAVVGENPSLEVHHFIIDRSRGADEILKSFQEWLRNKHLETRPGVRSQMGWLQRLCVYRLIKEGGLSQFQAMQIVQNRKEKKPGATWPALPISEAPENWSRSVTRVKRVLERDFIAEIRKDFDKLTPNPSP